MMKTGIFVHFQFDSNHEFSAKACFRVIKQVKSEVTRRHWDFGRTSGRNSRKKAVKKCDMPPHGIYSIFAKSVIGFPVISVRSRSAHLVPLARLIRFLFDLTCFLNNHPEESSILSRNHKLPVRSFSIIRQMFVCTTCRL